MQALHTTEGREADSEGQKEGFNKGEARRKVH